MSDDRTGSRAQGSGGDGGERAAVAEEQRYVDGLYRRLDEMRAYASDRLQRALLNTGGTPQARSERESFTRMYGDDLAQYDAAENGLCFGRIDVDSADLARHPDGVEARRIGRLGILDEEGDFDSLLLDWRAPLARPFYLATAAAPDGVRRRRHLRTRSRAVVGVADEYLSLEAAEQAGVGQQTDTVAGETALLAALGAARTGQMADIVETIQAEQDAIIRSEHKSVLVVQGGPGTGKTAVALHRAAYLLYTYRKQLDRSGVLIIGPNSTFLDYIGQVLPSLGETGVLLSTIGDLYPGVRATRADGVRASELKGSTDIVKVLKKAVRDRQAVPEAPIALRFDGVDIALDKSVVASARGRARQSGRPHNLARPIFVKAAVDALAGQVVAALGKNIAGGPNLLSASDVAEIRDEMREDSAIMVEIGELWPELTPQEVLSALWADPLRLASAAPSLSKADREALARSGSGFSPADAPLLDELAELLGVDDSAAAERARKQWRKAISDAQGALDILTGSAPQDLEDELDPEILMAYDLVDAGALAARHDASRQRTAAERAAGDRTWTYGHVIVDEAQELSPMAWRMLMRRIPNRWMTLVGDTAQTGDPAGTSSWQEVLGPYVDKRWKLAELTVNYRTPSEIMAVARDVLAAIDPAQQLPRSVRDSGFEPVSIAAAPESLAAQVKQAAAAETGPGTTAIIAPQRLIEPLRPLGAGRTSVLTVGEAKGLEFDVVILVEPAAIVGESPRGLSDLYVALTRATQKLAVIHAEALPEVLRGGGLVAL